MKYKLDYDSLIENYCFNQTNLENQMQKANTMIQDFKKNTYGQQGSVEKLKQYYEEKQWQLLEREAHSLKGKAMIFDLKEFAKYCSALQKSSKEQNEEDIKNSYQILIIESELLHQDINYQMREKSGNLNENNFLSITQQSTISSNSSISLDSAGQFKSVSQLKHRLFNGLRKINSIQNQVRYSLDETQLEKKKQIQQALVQNASADLQQKFSPKRQSLCLSMLKNDSNVDEIIQFEKLLNENLLPELSQQFKQKNFIDMKSSALKAKLKCKKLGAQDLMNLFDQLFKNCLDQDKNQKIEHVLENIFEYCSFQDQIQKEEKIENILCQKRLNISPQVQTSEIQDKNIFIADLIYQNKVSELINILNKYQIQEQLNIDQNKIENVNIQDNQQQIYNTAIINDDDFNIYNYDLSLPKYNQFNPFDNNLTCIIF